MAKRDIKLINKDLKRLYQSEGIEMRCYYPANVLRTVLSGDLKYICNEFETLGTEKFSSIYVLPMVQALFSDLEFNRPELFKARKAVSDG